jgi:hypothetical protein
MSLVLNRLVLIKKLINLVFQASLMKKEILLFWYGTFGIQAASRLSSIMGFYYLRTLKLVSKLLLGSLEQFMVFKN